MGAEDVAEAIKGIREDVVEQLVNQYIPAGAPEEQWDAVALAKSIERDFGPALPIVDWVKAEEPGDGLGLRAKIVGALEEAYNQKEANVAPQLIRDIEKQLTPRPP